MRIGVTAPRSGLTAVQKERFTSLCSDLNRKTYGAFGYNEFHHGACVGGDEACVELAHSLLVATFIAHPSNLSQFVSRAALELSSVVHEAKPPLERNFALTRAVELLIACPATVEEVMRSGTWATIRAARKCHVELVIIYPDGSVG